MAFRSSSDTTSPLRLQNGHCHSEVFSVPNGRCHLCSLFYTVTVTRKWSVLLMVTVTPVFSAPYGHCPSQLFSVPYGHCHLEMFSAPYGHSHCSVQCPLRSLPLCSVQCSLWSLSLCSLPPLRSGNERTRSSYSLTSKRCSSQLLPPFQHSALPKILQWMSTAIRSQPSWQPRCSFLSPTLSNFFLSQRYLHWQHSRPVNIYIIPEAVRCNAADLLRILS